MTVSEKRLYIGGLYNGVKEDDLTERFSRFGTVKGVDIKVRNGDDGSPVKTFAYVSLETSDADLKKCFSTYSKTKWKGSELKLQLAKEDFIDRLKEERRKQAEAPQEVRPERKEEPVVENRLAAIPGIQQFQMKGAPPGTAIPGEQNWIVGKYGRVLPIVQMKKKGIKKVMKIDPSKLTHNLKRINEELDEGKLKVTNLTWELEDTESEITKKRKGEFPEDRKTKISKSVNEDKVRNQVLEVLENNRKLEEERLKAERALEIVPLVTEAQVDKTNLAKKLRALSKGMDMSRFDSDSEGEGNGRGKKPKRKMDLNRKTKLKKRNQKPKKNENNNIAPNKKAEDDDSKLEDSSIDKSKTTEDNVKSGVPKAIAVEDDNAVIIEGKRSLKAFRGTKSLKTHENEMKFKKGDLITEKKMQHEEKLINTTPVVNKNTLKSDKQTGKKKKPVLDKSNVVDFENTPMQTKNDEVDNMSISSTDTADLISRKKIEISCKSNVENKKAVVKSWLTGQHIADEFATGFNDSKVSRTYQNECYDDEDEIDDFEQFAKAELQKMNKTHIKQSKGNVKSLKVGNLTSLPSKNTEESVEDKIITKIPGKPVTTGQEYSKVDHNKLQHEKSITNMEPLKSVDSSEVESDDDDESDSDDSDTDDKDGDESDDNDDDSDEEEEDESDDDHSTNTDDIISDTKFKSNANSAHNLIVTTKSSSKFSSGLEKKESASDSGDSNSNDGSTDDESDIDSLLEKTTSKMKGNVNYKEDEIAGMAKPVPTGPTTGNTKSKSDIEESVNIEPSSSESDDSEEEEDSDFENLIAEEMKKVEPELTVNMKTDERSMQSTDIKKNGKLATNTAKSSKESSDSDISSDDEDESDDDDDDDNGSEDNDDGSDLEHKMKQKSVVCKPKRTVGEIDGKKNTVNKKVEDSDESDDSSSSEVTDSGETDSDEEMEVTSVNQKETTSLIVNKQVKDSDESDDNSSSEVTDSGETDSEEMEVTSVNQKQTASLIVNKQVKDSDESDDRSSSEVTDSGETDSDEEMEVTSVNQKQTASLMQSKPNSSLLRHKDNLDSEHIEKNSQISMNNLYEKDVLRKEKEAQGNKTNQILKSSIELTDNSKRPARAMETGVPANNGIQNRLAKLSSAEETDNSKWPVRAVNDAGVLASKDIQQRLANISSAVDADKKRLEALKQRQMENQEHKTVIQKALASIDKGSMPNKKIVFDSDDDDDVHVGYKQNKDDEVVMETSEEKRKADKTSKLFDSSSSADESDSDVDQDNARFEIKQQFEGSAGKKLASLQSRYANDERFRLDARFAESDSENEDDGVGADEDMEDEKIRSLKILQSVVGIRGVKAISKQDKAKKKFKDIGALKYDPSKEEHKQFELHREPKKVAEKSSKEDEAAAGETSEDVQEVVLPEVSKDKFYEISNSLRQTFINKAQESEVKASEGFSLLAAFGQSHDDDDDDDDGLPAGTSGHNFQDEHEAVPIPSLLRSDQLSLDSRFKVTEDDEDEEDLSSEDEEYMAKKRSETRKESCMEVDTDKPDNTVIATSSTFFFTHNDSRLADGAKFHRQEDLDTVRQKWLEKRFQLIENYRTKHKNYRRKHRDSGKDRKPGQRGGRGGRGGRRLR